MKITVEELKKIAKSKGLKGYSKLRKAELLNILNINPEAPRRTRSHTRSRKERRPKSTRSRSRRPKRKTSRTRSRKERRPKSTRSRSRRPKRTRSRKERRHKRTPTKTRSRKERRPKTTRSRSPKPPSAPSCKSPSHRSSPKNIIKIGGYKFIKGSAIGDGSCMFHSIIQLLKDTQPTRKEGIAFRKGIADSFTYMEYIRVGDGMKATMDLVDATGITLTDAQFISMNVLQIMDLFPNRKELREISEKLYRKFKSAFGRTDVYADEFMLAYTAKFLKLNIVVVGSNNTITSGTQMVKAYPTIFLYNYVCAHYEPLFGINGQKVFNWNETREILKDNRFLIDF